MLPAATAHFDAAPGYCNWATYGLPGRATVATLRACLDDWEAGALDPPGFGRDVDACRRHFATLVGTTPDRIAMPGAVSIGVGLVASSLPDGAHVLAAEEDFTSVLFPFLADDRLRVTLVPLDSLVDAVRDDVDLVAVSAVQSADGRVTDLDALAATAADHGVRTLVDATQAAGWLPLGADRFDVLVCAAYKWLCAPRGVGFLAVRQDVDWLVPRLAGWFAGAEPWSSIYGPPLRLADDAARFTVSPAWFDVAATGAALAALVDIGVPTLHDHGVGLANDLRARLGLPPADSAIVSLATDETAAAALDAAGIVTASRGGRTRLSFHVANDQQDAARAADVLGPLLG